MAVLKEDVAELKTDVAVLKEEVAELKSDMIEVKADIIVLKEEVLKTQANVAEMKTELQDTKAKVIEISLTQENEIRTNIRRVAEGHLDLSRNLREAMKPNNEVEMLSVKVSILESEVRDIKAKIS